MGLGPTLSGFRAPQAGVGTIPTLPQPCAILSVWMDTQTWRKWAGGSFQAPQTPQASTPNRCEAHHQPGCFPLILGPVNSLSGQHSLWAPQKLPCCGHQPLGWGSAAVTQPGDKGQAWLCVPLSVCPAWVVQAVPVGQQRSIPVAIKPWPLTTGCGAVLGPAPSAHHLSPALGWL